MFRSFGVLQDCWHLSALCPGATGSAEAADSTCAGNQLSWLLHSLRVHSPDQAQPTREHGDFCPHPHNKEPLVFGLKWPGLSSWGNPSSVLRFEQQDWGAGAGHTLAMTDCRGVFWGRRAGTWHMQGPFPLLCWSLSQPPCGASAWDMRFSSQSQ